MILFALRVALILLSSPFKLPICSSMTPLPHFSISALAAASFPPFLMTSEALSWHPCMARWILCWNSLTSCWTTWLANVGGCWQVCTQFCRLSGDSTLSKQAAEQRKDFFWMGWRREDSIPPIVVEAAVWRRS